MKKLILILVCVGMCACNESFHKQRTVRAAGIASEMIYVKDYRTNLCFAMQYPETNFGLMATVPCTPEVETLIGK